MTGKVEDLSRSCLEKSGEEESWSFPCGAGPERLSGGRGRYGGSRGQGLA